MENTNVSAAIPRALHHSWADKVVKQWKQTSDKQYQPDDYEQSVDAEYRKALYKLLGLNQDRSFTLSQPSGGHIYNDGFSL